MEATPSTGIQTMLLGRGLRVLLSISTHRLLPALVFGYASYFYYAFLGFPYESAIGGMRSECETDSFPILQGIRQGTMMSGGAVAFLVVYRTSWATNRFWEARTKIGRLLANVRGLASAVAAAHGVGGRNGEDDSEEQRFKADALVLLQAWITMAKAKLSGEPEIPEGLSPEQMDVLAQCPNKLQLVHVWMCALWNTEGRMTNAQQIVALQNSQAMIQAYYDCMKIKDTPLPSVLTMSLTIIMNTYSLVILPQYLALDFYMSDGDCRGSLSIPAIFFYLCITSLTILFFSGMCTIADEMDDPYGTDENDLPLKSMQEEVFKEIEELMTFTKISSIRLSDEEARDLLNGSPSTITTAESSIGRRRSLQWYDVFEGWMVKRGGEANHWKRLYICLQTNGDDSRLTYFDSEKKRISGHRGEFDLSEVIRIQRGFDGEMGTMEMATEARQYIFSPAPFSVAALDKWLRMLPDHCTNLR